MRTSLILLVIILILVAGCSLKNEPKPGQDQSVSSRQDHLDKPLGVDDGMFVSDVTIPDGAIVKPGEKFRKTWLVRNSGSNSWAHYSCVFFEGDLLNAPPSVPLPPASPGGEVNISIPMKAPDAPGVYKGYWNLKNDKGVVFGHTLWIIIDVRNGSPKR